MLIDGGEASVSNKVCTYLKAYEINHLNYFVTRHAHADHVGGLSGALNRATVDVVQGDATRIAEADILDAGCDISATVLKVGHHGSDTSTSYPFLREIMPKYAIISVGKDNEYGHPTDNTLSRLRDADVQVFRTDQQGTVICVSDRKTVLFEAEKKDQK